MGKKRSVALLDKADLEVLLYAGWMGHPIVGIYTDASGMRVKRCETNTLIEAMQITSNDKDVKIYGKDRGGYWRQLFPGPDPE